MYKNLDEIRKVFGITTEDPNEVRKELKTILARTHPDRSHGEFTDEIAKRQFFNTLEAIRYIESGNIESQIQSSLTVSDVQGLINTVVKSLIIPQTVPNSEKMQQRFEQCLSGQKSKIRSRYFIPRITLSTITGILSFLWLFPNLVKQHPILGALVTAYQKIFTVIWFEALLLTISLWIITKHAENKESVIKSRLSLESYQNKLFEEFYYFRYGNFSKDDFIQFIIEHKEHHIFIGKVIPSLGRVGALDLEVVQSLADLIFERAENKGVIEKVELKKGYRINLL